MTSISVFIYGLNILDNHWIGLLFKFRLMSNGDIPHVKFHPTLFVKLLIKFPPRSTEHPGSTWPLMNIQASTLVISFPDKSKCFRLIRSDRFANISGSMEESLFPYNTSSSNCWSPSKVPLFNVEILLPSRCTLVKCFSSVKHPIGKSVIELRLRSNTSNICIWHMIIGRESIIGSPLILRKVTSDVKFVSFASMSEFISSPDLPPIEQVNLVDSFPGLQTHVPGQSSMTNVLETVAVISQSIGCLRMTANITSSQTRNASPFIADKNLIRISFDQMETKNR